MKTAQKETLRLLNRSVSGKQSIRTYSVADPDSPSSAASAAGASPRAGASSAGGAQPTAANETQITLTRAANFFRTLSFIFGSLSKIHKLSKPFSRKNDLTRQLRRELTFNKSI
jgi:hypothetical protein